MRKKIFSDQVFFYNFKLCICPIHVVTKIDIKVKVTTWIGHKAKNVQNSWDHPNNLFKQWKVKPVFKQNIFFTCYWSFFRTNTLELFKFKLKKTILVQIPTEKQKIDLIKKNTCIDWLFPNKTMFLLKKKIIVLDNQLYKMMDAFVFRIT